MIPVRLTFRPSSPAWLKVFSVRQTGARALDCDPLSLSHSRRRARRTGGAAAAAASRGVVRQSHPSQFETRWDWPVNSWLINF